MAALLREAGLAVLRQLPRPSAFASLADRTAYATATASASAAAAEGGSNAQLSIGPEHFEAALSKVSGHCDPPLQSAWKTFPYARCRRSSPPCRVQTGFATTQSADLSPGQIQAVERASAQTFRLSASGAWERNSPVAQGLRFCACVAVRFVRLHVAGDLGFDQVC